MKIPSIWKKKRDSDSFFRFRLTHRGRPPRCQSLHSRHPPEEVSQCGGQFFSGAPDLPALCRQLQVVVVRHQSASPENVARVEEVSDEDIRVGRELTHRGGVTVD